MINGGIINTVAAAAEVCTTNNSSFPTSNLAYYKLDGDATDSAGTYNGTPSSGVTWGVGRFGPAGVFNGSSGYITTNLKSQNAGTYSFWFKGSTPAGLATLFNNNNVSSANKGVMIQGQTNGTLRVYIAQGNGTAALDVYTTNTFFDNNWHNAVLTWDLNSSGTNAYLYVDKVVEASGAANTGVWTSGQDSTYGLFIGAGRTNLQFFNGSIDQVRIFNTVLTANQVTELYEDEIECCTTDEVNYPVTNTAYYQLNGGTGTTVVDETGNSSGTSTNVTYAAGKFDDAAVFNGTSSRAQVPFASKPSLSTCTVSFWLKTTSTNTQALIGEGYSGNHWGNLQIFINLNKLNARSGNASNAEDLPWSSTSNVNTGSWVHCLVTMQGNTSKIYINGNLETTKTLTVTRAATTNPFTIGQFYANGTLFSGWTNNCSIDQVRIFPTAITAGQVAELYQEKQCGLVVPSEHFNTVIYTGNDTNTSYTRNITGVGFDPDLVWIKDRDNGNFEHALFDSVRGPGTSKVLSSNMTSQEGWTVAAPMSAFINDGFSVQPRNPWNANNLVNKNGEDFVAWCWKAGGAAVSNTNGTITSQVSANTDAGFSIVSYTGNNSTSATIGHGLGQAPSVVIVKARNHNSGWPTQHNGIYGLRLNDAGANNVGNGGAFFSNTPPNSSVFTVGGSDEVNDGYNYISYCFAEVEGYSKIGSYVGNTTSFPSVNLGFSPAFVMIKSSTSVSNWTMWDNVRPPDPATQNNYILNANLSNAEAISSGNVLNFTSTGFNIEAGGSAINSNSQTYIYMAFAAYN